MDAHRPLLHTPAELALILSPHHRRRLSKDLTCQFKSRAYQPTGQAQGYRSRRTPQTVCAAFDRTVTLLHQDERLALPAVVRRAALSQGCDYPKQIGAPGQNSLLVFLAHPQVVIPEETPENWDQRNAGTRQG